jgi:hypothetical protein
MMKWILRSVLIVFALLSSFHVVAMFGADAMAAAQMVTAQAHGPMPADCLTQCIATAHRIGAMTAPALAQTWLIIAILAAAITILPFVRRIESTGLSFSPRPPDLITLYAHYRI